MNFLNEIKLPEQRIELTPDQYFKFFDHFKGLRLMVVRLPMKLKAPKKGFAKILSMFSDKYEHDKNFYACGYYLFVDETQVTVLGKILEQKCMNEYAFEPRETYSFHSMNVRGYSSSPVSLVLQERSQNTVVPCALANDYTKGASVYYVTSSGVPVQETSSPYFISYTRYLQYLEGLHG